MAFDFGILSGVLGIGASIFGSASNDAQMAEERRLRDKQLDQQFEQDKKVYNFNWDQSLREYDYLLEGIGIKRAEEETIGRLKDQMALDQYKYNLAIREFDYANAMLQYQKSEQIYQQQLGFNNLAAQQAAESERQKLRETVMESAFEHQDMMIELLQQEGVIQARGVAGNSTARLMQTAMAQLGRNQAVLAESLVSAERQTGRNIDNVYLQKYGADLQAEANRMLKPMKAPAPPVPYRTPRATFQDPLKPVKGPEPVRGVNTMARPSSLGIMASGLQGIAAGLNMIPSASGSGTRLPNSLFSFN